MAPSRLPTWPVATILATVLGLILVPAAGTAHGPIHEQIDQISRDIQSAPGYPDLYLARAGLYRLDEDWDRVEADLVSAAGLGADPRSLAMIRVDMYLDQERFEDALEALIAVRRVQTTDVMYAHARAYQGLGDLDSALYWLNLCLKSPEGAPADLYLLRSELVLQRNPGDVNDAIAGLESGLLSRGFDIALTLRCLELEAGAGKYDDALARLATLETVFQRDEELLSRKGDLLLRAGRPLEAEAAYTDALSALESLPPSRRSSPATQELEDHLRSVLAEGSTD